MRSVTQYMMKNANGKSRIWPVLLCALGCVLVPAVSLAQIPETPFRAAVNQVPEDIFFCGIGNLPCNLTYRLYSEVAPDEINSPLNPVDGFPRYFSAHDRYVSDQQITVHFSTGGAGDEWYMVWDGVTGVATPEHAGWYGAQSKVLSFGEFGNSLSFNCLPVILPEACFPALDPRNGFNDTVRADGSVLSHIGGISPIPCPELSGNGLTTLTYVWEEAANVTIADNASDPVAGYDLYLLPDPLTSPTGAELAAAVRVASLSRGETIVTLDRADLSSRIGLLGSTTYVAALKLRYAAGLDSLYFSCNSALSGMIGAIEPGDAPFAVDVRQAAFETRCEPDRRFVVVTLSMSDTQVAKSLIDYDLFLDTDENGHPDASVEIRGYPAGASRARAGVDVLLRVKTDGDYGDVAGLSSFDDVYGRLQIVMDADRLTDELDATAAILSGEVKLRNSMEHWELGPVDWDSCP